MNKEISATQARIGVFTLFHPRIERYHLLEWLEYHLLKGIFNFWLIIDGDKVTDSDFDDKENTIWSKKPEVHLDTEKPYKELIGELTAQINNISKKYSANIRIRERYECEWDHSLSKRQSLVAKNILKEAVEHVEWIGFFDIDELVVGNLQILEKVGPEISVLQLRQCLFESRWTKSGQPISFSDLSHSYGVVSWCGKCFARPNCLKSWTWVHGISRKELLEGEVYSLPPKILRFNHFRGTSVPKNLKWNLPDYSGLQFSEVINTDHLPDFEFILSVMRSGSSLYGHLLADTNHNNLYCGEVHLNYKEEKDIQRLRQILLKKLKRPENKKNVFCDKILHKEHIKDRIFLINRAARIHIVLRHPIGIWKSLRKQNWSNANFNYLLRQFQEILSFCRLCCSSKIEFVSYYAITSQDGKRYKTNPTTGKPGWGDTGDKLKTGKVVQRTLAEDVKIDSEKLQMEIMSEDYKKIYNIFLEIVSFMGNPNVIGDCEILPLKQKLYLGRLNRLSSFLADVTYIDADEISQHCDLNSCLPFNDECLEYIEIDSILELFSFDQAIWLLRECFRILGEGGRMSIRCIDLESLVLHVANPTGSERKLFYHTHRYSKLNFAMLMNSAFRDESREFIFDRALLEYIGEEIGFTTVSSKKDVEVKQETSIKLPIIYICYKK